MVESDRPQRTIKYTARVIVCWITKARNTYSEYVILISTATAIARMRLYVTFTRTLPIFL